MMTGPATAPAGGRAMSIPPGPVRREGDGPPRGAAAQPGDRQMKYAILIYDENSANPSPEPPDPAVWGQIMGDYNAYTQMLRDTNRYLGGEALEPVTTATTVRVQDGKRITTDGPFAETKEALGGFYLVEAKDLDEALDLAAQCPGAQFGSIEVRPVIDFSNAGAGQETVGASAG
jgi:hypothetical protein